MIFPVPMASTNCSGVMLMYRLRPNHNQQAQNVKRSVNWPDTEKERRKAQGRHVTIATLASMWAERL